MKKILFIIALITFSGNIAEAQEPTVNISGNEIQLGMSKEIVLTQLLKGYDVRELSPTSYAIYERSRNGKEQAQYIGQVAFAKGKLTYAAKEWYHAETGSGFELMNILQAVLEQMEQRGETVASIKTRTTKEPGITFQEIRLRFVKREIVILSVDDSKNTSKQVSINEAIGYFVTK